MGPVKLAFILPASTVIPLKLKAVARSAVTDRPRPRFALAKGLAQLLGASEEVSTKSTLEIEKVVSLASVDKELPLTVTRRLSRPLEN
jgi:hypothetical protein